MREELYFTITIIMPQSIYSETNGNADIALAPSCTDKINSLAFHPKSPLLLASCWNNLVSFEHTTLQNNYVLVAYKYALLLLYFG